MLRHSSKSLKLPFQHTLRALSTFENSGNAAKQAFFGEEGRSTELSGPRRTSEGELEIELSYGGRKRLRVRPFKGVPLIDLREFWEAPDGRMLPSKKGIALTKEQWNRVAEHVREIDDEVARLADELEPEPRDADPIQFHN